jgi:hypothetical protein
MTTSISRAPVLRLEPAAHDALASDNRFAKRGMSALSSPLDVIEGLISDPYAPFMTAAADPYGSLTTL